MTTESTNKQVSQPSDNHKVFSPLGKYAVIAVIMVGIIVTTAIMLDKQLSKTETSIASIEAEIAGLNKVQESKQETEIVSTNYQVQPSTAEANNNTKNTTVDITATVNDSKLVNDQPVNEMSVATSDVTASPVTNETVTNEAVKTETIVSETVATESTDDSYQARFESNKTNRKMRMTEMFDRIKNNESKQLEQFKSQQSEQVARLRNQLNIQQHQIDALIQRNANMFNIRATNAQRNQTQREQMLNRI